MSAASQPTPPPPLIITIGIAAGKETNEGKLNRLGLVKYSKIATEAKSQFNVRRDLENRDCKCMSIVFAILTLVAAGGGATLIAFSGGPNNLQLFIPGAICVGGALMSVVIIAIVGCKAENHKNRLKIEYDKSINSPVLFQELVVECETAETTAEQIQSVLEEAGKPIRVGERILDRDNRIALMRQLLQHYKGTFDENSPSVKIFEAFAPFNKELLELACKEPSSISSSISYFLLKKVDDENRELKGALGKLLDLPQGEDQRMLLKNNLGLLADIATTQRGDDMQQCIDSLIPVVSGLSLEQKTQFLKYAHIRSPSSKVVQQLILNTVLTGDFLKRCLLTELAFEDAALFAAVSRWQEAMIQFFIENRSEEARAFINRYYEILLERGSGFVALTANRISTLHIDEATALCRADIEMAACSSLTPVVCEIYAQVGTAFANAEKQIPSTPAVQNVISEISKKRSGAAQQQYSDAGGGSFHHPLLSSNTPSFSNSIRSLSSIILPPSTSSASVAPTTVKSINNFDDTIAELKAIVGGFSKDTIIQPSSALVGFFTKNPSKVQTAVERESLGSPGDRARLGLLLISSLPDQQAREAIEDIDEYHGGFPNFNLLVKNLREQIHTKIGTDQTILEANLADYKEQIMVLGRLSHLFSHASFVGDTAYLGQNPKNLNRNKKWAIIPFLASQYIKFVFS